MTVSTEVDHRDYTGNGVTTSFPYTFRIFSKADLTVTVVDLSENISELVLDTDYTVSGAGGYTGGNVTLSKPLTSGYKISIARSLAVTQETDLRNQGKFFAEVHEDAFDKLTMLIQQVFSLFRLALRKPSSVANWYDALNNYIRNVRDPKQPQDAATKNYADTLSAGNTSHTDLLFSRTIRTPDAILQLPGVEQRKNKLVAMNDVGDPIMVLPESGTASEILIELAKQDGYSLIGSYPSVVALISDDAPIDGKRVTLSSYHDGLGYGGGIFKFDSDRPYTDHNGGFIISPYATYPASWNNQDQVKEWFYPSASLPSGCWVREDGDIHNILNYGAKSDSSILINHILNKMSDQSIAIYLPRGKYKVENFTRNIPAGGNINMTSMILYGEPTYGNTDQNYSWETCTVIQGAGDMFLSTVNTAIRDILFRNIPGSTKGKIFTLGAYAQCEIANCTFGPANYHFYNQGFGFDGYNVKPFFRNCRFYGAEIYSRYFEGTVAGYHEQDCYTSHNKRGLYLAAPVSSTLSNPVFEYNDDGAIFLPAYGYTSASYQLSITGAFFETNGAGPVDNYKDRSDPHIQIISVRDGSGTQPDASAARVRLLLENCSFVDVTDKEPAFGAVFVDSKTCTVATINCRIEPAISSKQKLITANKTFYVDPIGYYGDSSCVVNNVDDRIRTQSLISSASPMFQKNIGGSQVEMGHFGFNTSFNTIVQTAAVNLVLSTIPGAVLNGDIYVTVSAATGYAAYRYRTHGTSSGKLLTLEDSHEQGGCTASLSTIGHPTNYSLICTNNGVTANVTVSFVGTIH